jgi:filamentous hemagglutinin
VNGNSALAGASGAAMGEFIAQQMYPGIKREDLTEAQRQTISALGTLAAGLVGGVVGDSTANAVAGAQSGKNALENNNLNVSDFGKGMADYGQAVNSLNNNTNLMGEDGKILNPITDDEQQYALYKLATGTMPEGQDISKVIVDGYTDGVMIGGAWYLGPAAGISKVVTGSLIGSIANGTYQWYDLNQAGNENKSWDYKSSVSAAVTGALAPGRSIGVNAGIALGGSVFSDGLNTGSQLGAGAGALLGGAFGKYAPVALSPVLGPSSGFVGDAVGSVGGEFIGNKIKDKVNKKGNTDANQ